MVWRGWRSVATDLRAPAKRLAALLVMATLSACSLADQLSGHSIEYNVQAETVKNETLLINILRAAYRRTLQFTDLSTISGQVSVSGTAGFSFPFWGPRAGGQELSVANPSVSASNSPTYTVSVLNTKEFYQGILTPIPMKTLSYYIHIGFPEYLLLTLVVSEIEYGPPSARKRIANVVDRKIDLPGFKPNLQFSDLLKKLIAMGLTTEEVEETTKLGRPFAAARYPSPTDLANLDAKGIRVVPLEHALFQLEKIGSASRFCFDPNLAREPVYAGVPVGETGEKLPASLLCGAKYDFASDGTAPGGSGAKPAAPLIIRTHSTEGVIYYLGEIVRRQLHLIPPPSGDWDPGIFHLREGDGGVGAITASYEGKAYHIDVDPTGADRSSQVLDLVSELLAQNNSAKDLPAPNIIPIAR
jgi:hypothetical protein